MDFADRFDLQRSIDMWECLAWIFVDDRRRHQCAIDRQQEIWTCIFQVIAVANRYDFLDGVGAMDESLIPESFWHIRRIRCMRFPIFSRREVIGDVAVFFE